MQKKYMELIQNSVMHVFEHYCECIEETDYNSVLNCILSSLRNVRFFLELYCSQMEQSQCFYCEFWITSYVGYRILLESLFE